MGGGLIQLAAYGVEDIYLTGDPQITFFKVLYRRHTNFAVESIIQNFSTVANFGETVNCTISRRGDLIGRIFLHIELPAIPKFIDPITGEEDSNKKIAWVNFLGGALLYEFSIDIGGRMIDKQYGEWMYIWSQVSNRQDIALSKMIGNVPSMYTFTNGKQGYNLYIPLTFWFCRHNGLALPLIALSSSDVKLIFTFRRAEECYRIGPTNSINILEDIVPFNSGDYIKQTINGQTIYGYVMNYDYLQKKLYYIKIQSPTAIKKQFESYQSKNNLPFTINNNPNYIENIPYRIYNAINDTYCTPVPNTRENIEATALPCKPRFINSFLYVDYIYLDNEERSKFGRTNHEYLIEQIQFNKEIGITSPNVKMNLALNHPCKAFYWVAQLDSMVGPGTMNEIFNYTTSPIYYPICDPNIDNLRPEYLPEYNDIYPNLYDKLIFYDRYYGKSLVLKTKFILDGRERFCGRNFEYFNYVQPYEHHFRGPKIGINVYSPSLHPEENQPSSAINTSKFEDIILQIRLQNVVNMYNTAKIRCYTINYNILRICYNMGGLAFV